jgi:hypothetical protein
MKDGQTIGQWLNWDFEANGELIIKDKDGNDIYWEYVDGLWAKQEWDYSKGSLIYYESSNGLIEDNRIPKVIEHNGRKYKLIP